MGNPNIILEKSKQFAIRIIRLYQHLKTEKQEFILSKQILRSGTSIGANTREGVNAISTKEFILKLNIALTEAKETEDGLELLMETNYITNEQFESIYSDCSEIIAILTSIIKTTNSKL